MLADIYRDLPLTVSWEHISGFASYTEGTPANLIDESESTYYGTRSWIVDDPYMTKRIKVRHAAAALKSLYIYYFSGATYTGGWTRIYIVYDDESRESIYYQEHTYPGATYNPTITGPWNNVIGFDFEGYRMYWRNTSLIRVTISNIIGMGYVWQDVGLRVKTPSTIQTIPVAPLDAAHKLRVCKDGTVHGIDLLDVSDQLASDVRIYSGGIKALPKF